MMQTVMLVLPILPGKEEAWRRFCQMLMGSRRDHFESFRRRLGLGNLCVRAADKTPFQAILISVEVEQPTTALHRLAASEHPFDLWLKRHVLDLHGLDLQRLAAARAKPPDFSW